LILPRRFASLPGLHSPIDTLEVRPAATDDSPFLQLVEIDVALSELGDGLT
jgi:hypothetical protein